MAERDAAPISDPTDRVFLRALFDWLAPRYDSAVLAYSLGQDLRWKHVLVDRLDPQPGEHALDLGCGTGLVSERLARRLGDDAVVGIDLNLAMLSQAHARFPTRAVLRADAQHLPFRDATFDVVSAGYVFKYVELETLAREVRRVLRPGGRVGGYDFSAPILDSMTGRAYERYLKTILPWLGRRRDGGEGRWAWMLGFLAGVAPASRWEYRIADVLGMAGFTNIRREPSLGGAVTWVWATVPRPT